MTNKELSQAIRKALKENGFTSKDYSIRVRDSLYDTAVDIRIKNPLVRLSQIEDIAKQFKKVDWDEHAQEILAGCNIYVHCQYDWGIFDEVAAPYLETSKSVFNSDKYDGRKIADNGIKEIHFVKVNSVEARLIEYNNEQNKQTPNSYLIRCPEGLAVAMWRFKNLGTIYA